MKKINLMDIMESLNGDDVDGASAALHEWFVEQGKQVQARLSGEPVVESDDEEETVEESFVDEAEADPAKAFRASLNKAVAVMKKAGVLTPQDEQLIAKARAESSADALQGLSPKAAGMAAKLIKAPAAAPAGSAGGNTWEGLAVSGDPKTDAKGWLAIAQRLVKVFSKAKPRDEIQQDAFPTIVDCASYAIPLFQKGDVEGGLNELMPDADAQDAISGNVGPDSYERYFFDNSLDRHSKLSGKAPAAAPAKSKYADLELIDDDYFEVNDMVSDQIDQGKTSGVEKDVHWMRTGVTADVVWALDGKADLQQVAAQAGFQGEPDFSGVFNHVHPETDEDQEYSWLAFNAEGEPQHQTDAVHAQESVVESEETDECEEEKVEESADDLIAELNEAFKGLETVSDKLQNVEGAQVGEQGKVPVNTKATLPSHKGKDRLGGDPVEIKGKGHAGHALEKAPKVVDVKVKNTVQNGKEELKKVADKGDASALLNKKDGKENTQSPISGKGAKGLKK